MKYQSCNHCESKPDNKIKIGKNLKIFGSIFILIFLISFLPILEKLNESLLSYIKLIWWAVILGILTGGIIDYFIPEEFIFKYLGQKKKRTIFYAVIF
ncbi:MAG: hypothetical protein QF567_02795, partial [Candidatus Pacearchaeota archaeon]|nr:hypothetical protein [Candidatus Pacearchaeota archaeon]